MRSPKDVLLDQEVEATAVGTRDLTKPEGGKALARLQFFNQERNMNAAYSTEVEAEDGKKKSKSRDTSDDSPPDDYAQACIEAAVALQTPQTDARDLPITEGSDDLSALSPPTAAGPNWRFLGPSGMTNGQTYGDTRISVSGRISCVAIDPSNSNHILCGAGNGGVWESYNKGASWAPRTDYMPSLAIGALAFNPSAPNIVYCGTGEGNFYWNMGAGVYRSTDGGANWSVIASAPFVGRGFYDLIVDPANGNHLLGATVDGVYSSVNGGVAWTLRKGGTCWDIAMHPSGGAAAEILGAFSNGVYRSTNDGVAWTKMVLPGAPASFNRLAVDISRSNPSVAYAFGASGAVSYLWRRAGGVWTAITKPAGLSTSQAWYDWFLAVSPDNDSQIYLGAIEAYRGTLSAGVWNWLTISNKAGQDIHPDQHAIAINVANPNEIYIGNDGGMFYSPDRGSVTWTSLNAGLGITEIEYMAMDYGSVNWLMAGTQDNGSIRYTGAWWAWDHIADGDGGDCGVNRANPNVVYHSYYGMGMERSTTKGGFGSFSWISPGGLGGSLFYPPMEVCNDTVVQAGVLVWISRNQGTNWVSLAVPGGQTASAMYVPNPNTVFVGTTTGQIYRTTWTGAAWSALTALTTPRNAFMSDIHVSPSNLNRIWVTYTSMGAGGRIFRSDNGGATWINCTSAALPNLPLTAVEVDPGNANRVWVAADIGVYQSFNAGTTWTAFASGLPNSIVGDLIYHPHARVLRAGLRNRGVWEIPVNGWLTSPICGTQFNGSLAANQTQRWFTFNWPATWHVLWTVMPTSFNPGAPQVSWNVQVERANPEYVTYWISVTNLIAAPVTFEGRFEILSFY